MRHRTLPLLLLLAALSVAGCEQTSVASQEQIRSRATLLALTPTVTPTPEPPTATPPPPTATATPGPSPTPLPPTATPAPTATPLPPTATPNPALAGFSLCTQQAGDPEGGRFTARVSAITTTVESALERVTIALDVPGDSAAPHAAARCAPAGSAYEIVVDLDGWLQDDGMSASAAQLTQPLSGTKLLSRIELRPRAGAQSGASLALPISAIRPFRLTLEQSPYRLVLEIGAAEPVGPASDMLALPQPGAAPAGPIYYLQDGDIWRYADGKSANLTSSPEDETAFSASQGGRIAFCRMISAPGDAIEVSSLWVMELDGSNQQELADAGRSCADPVMSPDGKRIAFAVDEDATGAQPPRMSIWMIDLTSGAGPDRLTSPGSAQARGAAPTTPDEWSRFGPQWLGDDRLVYTGQAEDGRSTLFMLSVADRKEVDVGAPLLVADGGQGQSVARYLGFGRPVAAADGKSFAVEALRAGRPGADLLLLDAAGREQGVPPNDPYWSRPLAFGPDGTLYLLTSACASDVAQSYALLALPRGGQARTLAIGQTAGAFGAFAALDGGLAYVTLAAPGVSGARGPLSYAGAGASELWVWDLAGGRASVAKSDAPIRAVSR